MGTLLLILIIALAVAGWIVADTYRELAEQKRYRLVERCMTAPTRRNYSEVKDEPQTTNINGSKVNARKKARRLCK